MNFTNVVEIESGYPITAGDLVVAERLATDPEEAPHAPEFSVEWVSGDVLWLSNRQNGGTAHTRRVRWVPKPVHAGPWAPLPLPYEGPHPVFKDPVSQPPWFRVKRGGGSIAAL